MNKRASECIAPRLRGVFSKREHCRGIRNDFEPSMNSFVKGFHCCKTVIHPQQTTTVAAVVVVPFLFFLLLDFLFKFFLHLTILFFALIPAHFF